MIEKEKGMDDSPSTLDTITNTFISDLVISDDYNVSSIHESPDTYTAFVHLFACCVMRKTKYKHMIEKEPDKFETTFTPDDEALCMIILDNNINKWKKEAELKLKKCGPHIPKVLRGVTLTKEEVKDVPPNKYTMRDSDGPSNLKTGWGTLGLNTFYRYKECVVKLRDSDRFAALKKKAMELIAGDTVGINNAKRQKTAHGSATDPQEDLYDKYFELSKFARV